MFWPHQVAGLELRFFAHVDDLGFFTVDELNRLVGDTPAARFDLLPAACRPRAAAARIQYQLSAT